MDRFLLQRIWIGLQLGGVPTKPCGHGRVGIGLQLGGVPTKPRGHGRVGIGLQLGGVPTKPGGHGPVGRLQLLGGVPTKPGGQVIGGLVRSMQSPSSRTKPRLHTHWPSSRYSLGRSQRGGGGATQRPFSRT